MNRSKRTRSRVFASALALLVPAAVCAAICVTDAPAAAQYRPPPAEVVATLTPVYHEGHATYWYNGYWHYRDTHGGWAHYETEPAFLRDHRDHHPAEYHHYGRR